MHANYPIPGVVLKDIFPTPAPELMTGVPAFLGLVPDADVTQLPYNQPKMLKLWTQFPAFQGKKKYLHYAVKGFFENGGQLCYVVRLKDETEQALSEGLKALEYLDDIDLVCSPDMISPSAREKILEHCDRIGDRFAILDGEKDSTTEQIQKQRQALNSKNGAMYAPWIKVENDSGFDFIPACGHIAGVYARSDRNGGFYSSPANYIVEGALDIKQTFSNLELVKLHPTDAIGGVNCLRALPGRGIRIWGTRTLSADANWHYINVRRLFLNVFRWIERNLAAVVFEPNDFKLWIRIERELIAYFESLRLKGALKGDSPQEAFYVKCDAQTNPASTQEIGNVITEIGLAPTIPSEFIIVRLIHGENGVQVN
ncbi:MAG: phage tail sheath subtilisin-like domain-containing protein [Scytonematopsis contorta HA4267-MV1]|jgi:hypothetical protein|nr:phage tail sheath subtilisin-like domain-containing protein [Scytonematopsis contorta HA4267-MV1]